MLAGDILIDNALIKMKKFAYHPIGIGGYPKYNSNIMAHLTYILPRTKGDDNGNDQRRKDHCYTQGPPDHAPAYIFKKPENNVKIFHFSIAERD